MKRDDGVDADEALHDEILGDERDRGGEADGGGSEQEVSRRHARRVDHEIAEPAEFARRPDGAYFDGLPCSSLGRPGLRWYVCQGGLLTLYQCRPTAPGP